MIIYVQSISKIVLKYLIMIIKKLVVKKNENNGKFNLINLLKFYL